MAFCDKCGFELEDGDLFCAKCGHKMFGGETSGEESEEPKHISKEMLIKDLTEYKSALAMKRTYSVKAKEPEDSGLFGSRDTEQLRHTFIKFYWPYLVAAPIAYFVIAVSIAVFGVLVESLFLTSAAYLVAFIVAAVILLVGRSKAMAERDSANYAVMEHNKRVRDRKKEREDIDGIERKLRKAQNTIDKYEDLIPVKYRNETSLNTIIRQLKLTDAKTIEEVIAKMK
ncbi:MAG: zinc-ribbon domain-containing protein [Clostridiales bacterium]|nr:zinc-ribbon domain-containing protein [Clostridiales bacterium]